MILQKRRVPVKGRKKVFMLLCVLVTVSAVIAGFGTSRATAATYADSTPSYTDAGLVTLLDSENSANEFARSSYNYSWLNNYSGATLLNTFTPKQYAMTSYSGDITAKIYVNTRELNDVALIELSDVPGYQVNWFSFTLDGVPYGGIPFGNSGNLFLIPFNIALDVNESNLTVGHIADTTVYSQLYMYKNYPVYARTSSNLKATGAVNYLERYELGGFRDETYTEQILGYYIPYLDKYIESADIRSYTLKRSTVFHVVTTEYDPRSSIILPEVPASPREDWTFAGFYYDGSNNSKNESDWQRPYDGQPLESSQTLTARFLPEKVTLTFDTQGGYEMQPISYEYGTIIGSVPTPIKLGYIFKGWKLSTGAQDWGMVTNEFLSEPLTGDYKLTATWELKVTPLPPDPVKEGYTFTGWFTDKDCTVPYTGDQIIGDVTLYAGFVINKHTATIVPGTTEYDGSTSISFDWNTAPTLPTLTKEGYTFAGWFIGDVKYENTPLKADTTLTAKWTINKHTATIVPGTTEYDGSTSISFDWNTAPVLPTLTKEGYTFAGWFIGETEYKNTPLKADATITAKWTVITCTVTLNLGGAEYDGDRVITIDWNTAPELPEPTLTGYTFTGWYLSDGTVYDGAALTDNVTLTAGWAVVTYTVTFIVDGEVYTTIVVDHGSVLG